MKFASSIFLVLLSFSLFAQEISVTTYNVNYSFVNEKIFEILDEIDSDIVCLQETNLKWEEIIQRDLSEKYPHIYFKHLGTASGLAVLSKYPIEKTQLIYNKPGWFPALVITVKKDNHLIQFLNVHLKPKLTNKGRIGWKAYFEAEEIHQKELAYFINELDENLPTVILGDFNEKDKGDALTWLQSEKSYTNALPQFDKRTKTWRFGFLKSRFDHILYNQEFSCISAKVSKLGKSDHFPVQAILIIN